MIKSIITNAPRIDHPYPRPGRESLYAFRYTISRTPTQGSSPEDISTVVLIYVQHPGTGNLKRVRLKQLVGANK